MRWIARGLLARGLLIAATAMATSSLAATAASDGMRTVLLPGGPDEGVGIVIPEGWALNWRDEHGPMAVLEFLPEGETAEEWTEMIAVQRFTSMPSVDPAAFLERVQAAFSAACPGIVAGQLLEDVFETLPIALHSVGCTLNPDSGKGEIALFTAVAGRQALYVFQRSWRVDAFTPETIPLTGEVINAGSADIGRIFVCAGDVTQDPHCPPAMRDALATADISLSPLIR